MGEDARLPALAKGGSSIRARSRRSAFTEPPPRYSEATLIKKMEERHRPSTYAQR
jgi:DNA topoisomerase IA